MTKSDIERLAVLEQKVDDLKEDVCQINDKLDKFIEAADKKYAPQYLEKVFWASFGTIFAAVLGVLAYLINNHFKF